MADHDSKIFLRSLGNRIRLLREQAGMSQEGLAVKCNLSPLTISNIELGNSEAKIGTIFSIADALGLNLPELFSYLDAPITDRQEQRAIARITRVLAGHDLQTLDAVEKIVETALDLPFKTRKKRRR